MDPSATDSPKTAPGNDDAARRPATADRTTVVSTGTADAGNSPRAPHRLHETLGPYRLIALLGTGGMALVYEAVTPTGKRVALKVMHETPFLPADTLERFRREAEAARVLGNHPGVISVFDTGKAGHDHYIAMELVPGGRTIEALLKPPLQPVNAILPVAIAIAEALAHAHDRGIIHRDIKPGNILLDPEGKPRLADFGLARAEFDAGRNLTISAMTMGTPRYMSPEQIASTKYTTPRSDMYSFGVILYELLTGRLPYDLPADAGIAAILEIVRGVRPIDPRQLRPEISKNLAAVLLTLLEKDPADRYQDMHAVTTDLRACLDGSKVSVRIPTPFERVDRLVRRHPFATLALVLGVVSAICLWRWQRQALDTERRNQMAPTAQAISQAKELEAVKRALNGPLPLSAHEQALRDAHAAVLAGDLQRAEDLLAPLAAAPDSDVGRTACRELGRVKLAAGDWENAQRLFAKVATGYERIRNARRLQENNPSLTDPRVTYARFEEGLAWECAGRHRAAQHCWQKALAGVQAESPLGRLCVLALGELSPAEAAASAARASGAFRALGFWLAARQTHNPEEKKAWRHQAEKAAREYLPWLFYRLRNTIKQECPDGPPQTAAPE